MKVPVSDPVGAIGDPAMPMLRSALQPAYIAQRLHEILGSAPDNGRLELQAIRVRRHKPGRRCLVEYQLTHRNADGMETCLNLLGKIRAKGLDRRSYDIQNALWRNTFGPQADDRIGVPPPLGVLPELAMWLQCRVDGVPAMQRLTDPNGAELAGRIAGAIHKLQCAGPPAPRRHGIADELRILHQQLTPVAEAHPSWAKRIQHVLAASGRLGASLPDPVFRPSHRDCYADNVMVNGTWLYLVDLDLYCMADPALDIGNFIGHVTEFALRSSGQSDALVHLEQALESGYVDRAGEAMRAAVRVYATLTLVRHIAISHRIPDRRVWTPQLLRLCERRLGIVTT
jgi:hypothetical protein